MPQKVIRRRVRRAVTQVVLGLAIGGLLLGLGISNLLGPINSEVPGSSVRIAIPAGSSGRDIASILAREGLIKSEVAFLVLTRLDRSGGYMKAGEYQLSPTMTPREIIAELLAGNTVAQYVRVTIPEGFTVVQIAELLAQEGLVDRDRFLDVVETGQFHYDFIEEIPTTVDYRLEGYLFPDTYHLERDMGEWAIINHFLQRFDQVLSAELRKQADQVGLTIHDAVTLASIIEREARLASEQPLISGVFHNRLDIGMRLQSCATVQYVLGEPKERLLLSDLEIPSPYNTYLNAGLPPGPVATPGSGALQAAVAPEETEYLFFVARTDGSHVFSRTLAEHNRAKNQI